MLSDDHEKFLNILSESLGTGYNELDDESKLILELLCLLIWLLWIHC